MSSVIAHESSPSISVSYTCGYQKQELVTSSPGKRVTNAQAHYYRLTLTKLVKFKQFQKVQAT